ncbi:homeobox protein 2 [Anopheles nili]|uniref:homeobox protein 2 n=1 Tax=Anopheles nili TaxID=185578 RepID=UPI00237C3718|nr:homeobox protein 2 [Anopheles nili]
MWNKLFKSKSKSSKNLSNRSCSSGPEMSSSNPGSSKLVESIPNLTAQYEQYGSGITEMPEPVRLRSRSDLNDLHVQDSAGFTNHRDSVSVEMCGIPMRRSKLSSAFRSLSLKRSASKSRLKLVKHSSEEPNTSISSERTDASWKKGLDDYAVITTGKRASLRSCKSDNNLDEKQQYAEFEKEQPVYIKECKSYDMTESSSEPPLNLDLQPCPICLRKFAPASLNKHTAICERVQSKKRKPFDSSRQRREGTELASYLPKNFGLPQKTVSSSIEAIPVRKLSLSKTPTFERKNFNSTTMSTSMPSASNTPKPVLKRSMSQQNEPCPYCERCFGMKAYDRHVEWCREKALLNRKVNNNQIISAAKERLQARIQYKAPQIRSKRALNREKYSGSLSCGGSTNSLAELDLHMPRHNSMSSSVSSDNRKFHPSPPLLQRTFLGINHTKDPKITIREETRKVAKRTKTFTLSNDRLHNDTNNNNNSKNINNNNNKIVNYENNSCCNHENNSRNGCDCHTQIKNLLYRSTLNNVKVNNQDKIRTAEKRIEKFEIIGQKHSGRKLNQPVISQTVLCTSDSGYSPDRYDPFLSARRQLEELFSPTTSFNHMNSSVNTTSTSRLNQIASNGSAAFDKMANSNTTRSSPLNSNFRRAFSLRMPRKVSRPMYIEKAKSNIQKGITDDGPVSPNFLKSSEYDELPIKSTFNALQMSESKPKLRDSSTVRKNLKLENKDLNNSGSEILLSKTDSLAVFLKYENELALSEKDIKDKSNSLSKRTLSLNGDACQQNKQEPPNDVQSSTNNNVIRAIDEAEQQINRNLQRTHEAVLKKPSQKLIPIKLEPSNISYNDSNESDNMKPMVISLDAIIGKPNSSKTKQQQTNNDFCADSYIDPKLINKCDNLPIIIKKAPFNNNEGSNTSRIINTNSNVPAERQHSVTKKEELQNNHYVTLPASSRASTNRIPKALEITNSEVCSTNDTNIDESIGVGRNTSDLSSPITSYSSSPSKHNSKNESITEEKRSQLNRHDREDSGHRTGQESGHADRQKSPCETSSLLSHSKSHYDTAPQTDRITTNYQLNQQPAQLGFNIQSPAKISPIVADRDQSSSSSLALEHFDVDEFMQSLEDLQRRSSTNAKDFKNSQFGRTTSFVCYRSAASNQNVQTNSKRSNSLDSSSTNNVVTSNHFIRNNDSIGVPRVDVCVRNGSGIASNHNSSSNNSSSFSSPSHYRNNYNYSSYDNNASINNNNLHNHSTAIQNKNSTPKRNSSDDPHPVAQQTSHTRSSSAVTRKRLSEATDVISFPVVLPSSTDDSLRSGSISAVQSLPSIHKNQYAADSIRNGNGSNVQHLNQSCFPASLQSPGNGRKHSYGNKLQHANHSKTLSTIQTPSSITGYVHNSQYPSESFDHLERDLLKSVQELDRMCGSTSSICSIDSEDLYNAENYTPNKRSSERSQTSADSAYRSSLSTQSPPDHGPPLPIRQARPVSRASSATQNHPPQTTDTPDMSVDSFPSHTSLPPLTSAKFKGHKMELNSNKETTDAGGLSLIMNPMSKFCHECGARFMVCSAKFCMSCGVRRIMIE